MCPARTGDAERLQTDPFPLLSGPSPRPLTPSPAPNKKAAINGQSEHPSARMCSAGALSQQWPRSVQGLWPKAVAACKPIHQIPCLKPPLPTPPRKCYRLQETSKSRSKRKKHLGNIRKSLRGSPWAHPPPKHSPATQESWGRYGAISPSHTSENYWWVAFILLQKRATTLRMGLLCAGAGDGGVK